MTATSAHPTGTAVDRGRLGRRAQLLAGASVACTIGEAVVADSTQTLLCTYLSAALLVGLVLTATLGWGWADPIAGLVIAAVAAKEGVGAWRGEGCCAPGSGGHAQEDGCGRGDGCPDTCCAPSTAAPAPHGTETTRRPS